MMMKKILFITILFLLFAPALVGAEQVSEQQLDTQIRDIAKTLRCAVCQSESVWESNAELARQMRQIIRERLLEGQTPDEIKTYFLSRYGDYILMEPRKKGLNWLLWIGPFLLLALGGALLYRSLRIWVVRTSTEQPEAAPPLDERHRKRIERELRSLEK
jgi:cytochrome c-type biogenesis protein CcmH